MAGKREAKKEELKERLIHAAEVRIVNNGLAGLKARDVTSDAGCALGALYNAFEDLDRLILEVNSRTLKRLGSALRDSVPAGAGPVEVFQALAQAYVDFACDNTQAWSALFDHRLPEGVEMPDWHRQDHAVLIEQIIAPLAVMRPDLSPEARILRARTIFAAVHGVVRLAMEGRFVGVPRESLSSEVSALVTAMTRGLSES